jgi:Zn-dependent protease with chaperone function
MSFNTGMEKSRTRLNPFVFLSATNTRFLLLIIAIIGITLAVYSGVYTNHIYDQETLQEVKQQTSTCISQLEPFSGTLQKSIESGNLNLLDSRNSDWNQCVNSFNTITQKSSLFALVIVVLLLGFSGIICYFLPLLMIRKEKMVALENQSQLEEVISYLEDLCRQVGLLSLPKFLLKPTSRAIGGRVFGFWKRYYLVLPTGLIILYDKDREAFRSILLHELSHLKNQDVDRTYFSIVGGFIFITAILFAAIFTWKGDYFYIIPRITAFALLIYLLMTSVIRSREFYADIRASLYSSLESIQYLLNFPPQKKSFKWKSTLISLLDRIPKFKQNKVEYLQSLFQFHPSTFERYQVLEFPEKLCHFNFWEAVSIGLITASAFDSVSILIVPILTKLLVHIKLNFLPEPFIAWFFFSPLIVGIIGLGIWREAYVSLVNNDFNYERSGKLGLGLGLGLIVGGILSPYNQDVVKITVVSIWHQPLITATWTFLWNILLLVLLYYLFKWIAVCASTWVKVSVTYKSIFSFYLASMIFANILLLLILGGFYYIDLFANAFAPKNINEFFLEFIMFLLVGGSYIAYHLIITVACCILWMFPLSSWFWQRKLTDSKLIPRSFFLDPPPYEVYLPADTKIQIGPGIILGLKGGLLYFVLLVSVRLLFRVVIPGSVGVTAISKLLLFFGGFIGLGALIQIAVALKIANKIKYLSVINGLFAAFIAACIMVLSAFIVIILFGDILDFSFAFMIFKLMINWGALLSLLAFLIFSWRGNRRLVG